MSFVKSEKNGVPFYRSTILNTPHAFSTREGGVSTIPYLSSLNLGENRGDDRLNVQKNFDIFLSAAELPKEKVWAHQIHSDILRYEATGHLEKEDLPACDGFYTDKKGVTLCVKIADCIPILLFDEKEKLCAAAHAGWRGTAANIAGKAVQKLISLGAKPENIVAAIGPGIGKCCYEVGEDFVKEFTLALGTDTAPIFIDRSFEKPHADLKAANKYLLEKAGVPSDAIDVCPLCTCHDPAQFFSHRASGGKRGTMVAAISLGKL